MIDWEIHWHRLLDYRKHPYCISVYKLLSTGTCRGVKSPGIVYSVFSVCLFIGKGEGIAGYGRKSCFSPVSHTSSPRHYGNTITLSLLCGGSGGWGGGGEGGIYMGFTESYRQSS